MNLPKVPALSNWAHQALWEGGSMVQSSGWTPYTPYSALGDPIRSSPCSDMTSSETKLHQKSKMSLIISVSARNWQQAISLDSKSPNPSKVYTHTRLSKLYSLHSCSQFVSEGWRLKFTRLGQGMTTKSTLWHFVYGKRILTITTCFATATKMSPTTCSIRNN